MKTGLFVALLLIAGLAYAYWQNLYGDGDAPQSTTSTLQLAGNACEIIASKAAMHLPEALPFQKLEKQARQSRVLGVCMADRGYIENPAWVQFVAPKVKAMMQQQSISENEAYETIKREAMLVFVGRDKSPLYWQAKDH